MSISADDPRLTRLSAIAPETDVLMGFYEDGLGVHNYNAPLVREARLGLLVREANRLAEEGGDA